MSFNFTVAIAPSTNTLHAELKYVKSALLYADKVTLISPLAYMFTRLTDGKYQLDEKGCVRLLKMLVPFCMAADIDFEIKHKPVLDEFYSLIHSKKYKNCPALEKLKIKKELQKFAKQVNDVVYELLGNNACADIKYLLDSGMLSLQKFEHSLDDAEGCVSEYFRLLQASIKSSFPLFDEKSNDLMSTAIKMGVINLSEMDKRKATHAGISDDYIQRLPSLEMASVDEIIDIKNTLSGPLINFRSKMLTFSDQVITLPWDEDFNDECMLLYHKEVLPAIQELDELTKDSTFIKNLIRGTVSDKELLKSTAGLLISIATGGAVSAFTSAVSANPAVLTAGTVWAASKVADAYLQHSKQKKGMLKNDLYFYYKAGKLLS